MSIFLDTLDSVPLNSEDFDFQFESWLTHLVDDLNTIILQLQDEINGLGNGLIIPPKTNAEIVALEPDAADGTMWYSTDHVPPVIVAKVNGALVQLSTAAYP